MSYLDFAKSLNIEPGSIVYLSSRVFDIAISVMEKGEKFDPDLLIDSFLTELGTDGTLLIPTFCFDFSNRGLYDRRKPKCFTGSLGKAALKRKDFRRTAHPMHSFAVAGSGQADFCQLENRESFGPDSPFALMRDRGAINVMLGTDCEHAFTFAHFVEASVGVPHRFVKSFTGTYIDEDGSSERRQYDYYARNYEINPVEHFDRIGAILLERGISKRIELEDSFAYVVDMAASVPVIEEDIVRGQCRNMYDFDLPREVVFEKCQSGSPLKDER